MPQLLLTATGRHRKGVLQDLTAYLLEHGASICSSRKVMLHSHFSCMLAVWLPPDGTPPDKLAALIAEGGIQKELGCCLTAEMLKPADAAESVRTDGGSVFRRLRLSTPQKPGIVKSVTELLKAHSCTLTEIDADTRALGNEVRPRPSPVCRQCRSERPTEPPVRRARRSGSTWSAPSSAHQRTWRTSSSCRWISGRRRTLA